MAQPQERSMQPAASVAAQRPPVASIGVVGWLRKNLFSTWYNALLTVIALWLTAKMATGFVTWATTSAKWIVITANLKLYMVGQYPDNQLWRIWTIVALVSLLSGISWGVWGRFRVHIAAGVMLVALLLASGPIDPSSRLWWLVCGALVPAGYGLVRLLPGMKRWPVVIWILALPLCFLLIRGWDGSQLLPLQPSRVWNGLLLTVMVAVTGMICSFPLGVLLALGRQSTLPAVRIASIIYIEVIRGVPLLAILYFGAYILPVFLPASYRPDQFLRAVTAITLFSAAYLAENVRGGLQAIPKGQREAAQALGLPGWQILGLIVLPQALRIAIPAIVGQFIGGFKDTSLLTIVTLIELMGIGQAIIANPDPNFLNRHFEVYVFAAAIYFVFSFTLSYGSRRLEKALGVGER